MGKFNNLINSIADTPYGFYRAIYKNGPGLTIGMQFKNGDTLYNDDLRPQDEASVNDVTAVLVSSIVEGSEVEIGPVTVYEPFEFWQVVKQVSLDVSFYWERDNSLYLKMEAKGLPTIHIVESASTGEIWTSNDERILGRHAVDTFNNSLGLACAAMMWGAVVYTISEDEAPE